jgi:hypothetical protein
MDDVIASVRDGSQSNEEKKARPRRFKCIFSSNILRDGRACLILTRFREHWNRVKQVIKTNNSCIDSLQEKISSISEENVNSVNIHNASLKQYIKDLGNQLVESRRKLGSQAEKLCLYEEKLESQTESLRLQAHDFEKVSAENGLLQETIKQLKEEMRLKEQEIQTLKFLR